MNKLLVLALLSTVAFSDVVDRPPYTEDEVQAQAKRHSKRIRDQIDAGGMVQVRSLTTSTVDALIRKAHAHLIANGFKEEAEQILIDWETDYQFSLFTDRERHIGDHPPLSVWLRLVYTTLKLSLGLGTVKSLHLSDIETINSAVPVVFHPCDFPMGPVTISRKEEYKNHFAKDVTNDVTPAGNDGLYGLIPVVTYWAIEAPCMIGTSGILSLICSPVSTAAEFIMAKTLAPKLSDKIFDRVCGPQP